MTKFSDLTVREKNKCKSILHKNPSTGPNGRKRAIVVPVDTKLKKATTVEHAAKQKMVTNTKPYTATPWEVPRTTRVRKIVDNVH